MGARGSAWQLVCLGFLSVALPAALGIVANWKPPNKTEWRKRTIYQLLTDRFDTGNPHAKPCPDLETYCGGKWKGIKDQIAYIKDLGFDAVWFTPIVEQTGGPNWAYPDGYHGYWPKNSWNINRQFGSEQDLQDMIDALHEAGMWAMLDIVPNHSGYGPIGDIAVFNDNSYYHDCSICLPGCNYGPFNDQQIRHCRLSNLPDLDQDNPYVAEHLTEWVNMTWQKWQLDGYRVDAAKHMEINWLANITNLLPIYTIGEFADQLSLITQRMAAGALDAPLSFPVNEQMLNAFMHNGPMTYFRQGLQTIRATLGPLGKLPIMGNFQENHDQPRFLCVNNDPRMMENSHAFLLFAEGIPIVYYGAEVGMRGMRDALWPLKLPGFQNGELYRFIRTLTRIRRAFTPWDYPVIDLSISGDNSDYYYAFQRGKVVVLVTSLGKHWGGGGETLTLGGISDPLRGTTLKEGLQPLTLVSKNTYAVQQQTTLTVNSSGYATLVTSPDRWPMVFYLPGPESQGLQTMGRFVPYVIKEEILGPDGMALVAWWALSIIFGVALYWRLACKSKGSSTGAEDHPDAKQPLPLIRVWMNWILRLPHNTACLLRLKKDTPSPSTQDIVSASSGDVTEVDVEATKAGIAAAHGLTSTTAGGVTTIAVTATSATGHASAAAVPVVSVVKKGDSSSTLEILSTDDSSQSKQDQTGSAKCDSVDQDRDQLMTLSRPSFTKSHSKAGSGLAPAAGGARGGTGGQYSSAFEAPSRDPLDQGDNPAAVDLSSTDTVDYDTPPPPSREPTQDMQAERAETEATTVAVISIMGGSIQAAPSAAVPVGSAGANTGGDAPSSSGASGNVVSSDSQELSFAQNAIAGVESSGATQDSGPPAQRRKSCFQLPAAAAVAHDVVQQGVSAAPAPSAEEGGDCGDEGNEGTPRLAAHGGGSGGGYGSGSTYSAPNTRELCRMLAAVSSCPAQCRASLGKGSNPQQQPAAGGRQPQAASPPAHVAGQPQPPQQAPTTGLAGHSSLPHKAQLLAKPPSTGREAAGGVGGMKALRTGSLPLHGPGSPAFAAASSRVLSRREITAPTWLREIRALTSLDPAAAQQVEQILHMSPRLALAGIGAQPYLQQMSLARAQSAQPPVPEEEGEGKDGVAAHKTNLRAADSLQIASPFTGGPGVRSAGQVPIGAIQQAIAAAGIVPSLNAATANILSAAGVSLTSAHTLASVALNIPQPAPPGSILHVAMEYSIPHLGMNTQFMYGGLGKVVDLFLREWTATPIGLCCPLYAEAYKKHKRDRAPRFLPENAEPDLQFTAIVNRRPVPVELFVVPAGNVTYYFVQAEIFRFRKRGTIYQFSEEKEMLTWASVFNQAVSIVISTYGFTRVQYHDWHGTLSLMYLPHEVRPEVMYVAHNAHYDGVFPMPNSQRRVYLYNMFDLDAVVSSRFLEHKGSFDMLSGVVGYIRDYQHGIGCVAVSPRYAEQIMDKLSVFWQLKRGQVKGVLNALPLADCMAAEVAAGHMTLDKVLKRKASAKAQLQAQLGLHVSREEDGGEPWELVVFMGRMTHQKGCDIIARAAPYFMRHAPRCQLVIVGPVGDATGAEAQQVLVKLVEQFPGRVYAPPNKYMTGAEKAALMTAADWCLVPSRFEPCGLVDIEFGWEGALMIGHDTGGLGKMPGVYYTVESSGVEHLAAKLGTAVVKALNGTSHEAKVRMIEDALNRRFSVAEMMEKYEVAWGDVSTACEAERRQADDEAMAAAAAAGEQFFSHLWRKHNLQDPATRAAARTLDRGRLLTPLRRVLGLSVGRQELSSYLLLILMALCQLPGLMTCAYCAFVFIGFTTITGCQQVWDLSWVAWPKEMNDLGFRVMLYTALFALFSPVWALATMRMRPRTYVLMTVWATFLAAVISHAAMYWTIMLNFAIIFTAVVAPMGIPLISLNFLGEAKEVAEVGLSYMTIMEVSTGLFRFAPSLLAALCVTNVPFVAVNGLTVFICTLYVAWFMAPDTLHPAYSHYRLVIRKQWAMLLRIRTFWLTSLVMICENVSLILTAYATLLRWRLSALMALAATTYGATTLSLLLNYGLMRLRCSQLRVQSIMILIAALPGFAVAQQVSVIYAGQFWGIILTAALVSLVYGCRFQLVGLLAFQTLPTRELVAIWQLNAIFVGTVIPFVVLVAGYTSRVDYSSTTPLLIGVGACEVVRLGAMAILSRIHGKENLSSL